METEIAIDLVEGDWGTVVHRKENLFLSVYVDDFTMVD